ncbi:Opsin-1 [Cyphellophora attinorum]|uniref:Opsin-1 n=1 Tax=Cyphellophora attinorum TaxID=1664694 RepID=A0A0N1HXX6_9EURO|nr:Opsin-1 [Phialophora attinorum]KPI45543.1 Opsin-1 [Phialophora attinorum]
MIVEPGMVEALKKATSTVAPIPTVIPGADPIYQTAGDVGNRTLWAVCIIMALSSLAFYGMAFRQPVQKRLFHILTAFITTFAFLSYFAMASGDGISLNKTVITESHKHVPDTEQIIYREVYWARYVDWSVTTPLLLMDLALMAGLSGANILVAIVADVIMVLTGLFAAYGKGDGQKWGWYAWACIAYLVVVYQLAVNGRSTVASKDSKTKAFYGAIAGFTLILWTVYPIIWGIADGGRLVGLDAEIISYAVLDVLAKPVFGFWLLFTHDSMSSTSPSLEGFWSNGFGSQGTLRVGDD